MNPFDFVKSENPYYQEVILYYKTNPCSTITPKSPNMFPMQQKPCPHNPCFSYHNTEERRRPVFDEKTHNLCYNAFICPAIQKDGICENDDACKFCHNQNELQYHPLYYKTEPCNGCNYENNPKLCPRFHADELSRSVLLERFQNKKTKESLGKKEEPGLQDFDLDNFKTMPCQSKGNHNPKYCYYYHHEKDRRRPTTYYNYSSDTCPKIEKNQECPNGENCRYAHNKVEQLYHPDRYKRKFCTHHPHKLEKCDYGNFCSFAHHESEIKIELLHNLKQDTDFYIYKYKTVFCPYIYEHDRSQCVYAHNAQDFRRSPLTHKYDPIECPNWSKGQIFSYEEGGCPKQMNCEKCHGWKELEFHPLYFKTKPCTNGNKCVKRDCPFYHSNADRRTDPFKQDIGMQKSPEIIKQLKNNQLNAYSNSFQPSTFSTPTKAQPFKNEFEEKTFASDPQLGKKAYNQKNSHYKRPVMPVQFPSFQFKEQDFPREGEKKKAFTDLSTRPNSGVSSTNYSEDDNNDGEFGILPGLRHSGANKRSRRNKGRLSVEHKKERIASPLSTGSDQTGMKPVYNKLLSAGDIWSSNKEDMWPKFAEKDKEPVIQRNESYESLQSYSNDKFSLVSEKQAIPINQEHFKNQLAKKLEHKDFSYAIPYLINPNVDFETLKNFSHKDFSKFPQIKDNDKEKIMMMIQDILEEESVLAEINTIHEDIDPFQDENIGSYDSNFDVQLNKRKYSGLSSH